MPLLPQLRTALVVAELVANAFGHAAPPYRVRLTSRGHVIRLAVTDVVRR